RELDAAVDNGTNVRHWCIIDNAKPCPPERHLPAEPRIPIYYNESELKAIGKTEYDGLNPEAQEPFKAAQGYTGCLKNCSIFAQCRGRLATKPKSKSRVMKSVAHTVSVFRELVGDVETALCQLMSWKPEASGL